MIIENGSGGARTAARITAPTIMILRPPATVLALRRPSRTNIRITNGTSKVTPIDSMKLVTKPT